VVAMHGALSDYLIKVVPSWIKFAVAGPGQSTNVYNEQTLYTKPEHLMPLIRCACGKGQLGVGVLLRQCTATASALPLAAPSHAQHAAALVCRQPSIMCMVWGCLHMC
jgi:hypothetical protein